MQNSPLCVVCNLKNRPTVCAKQCTGGWNAKVSGDCWVLKMLVKFQYERPQGRLIWRFCTTYSRWHFCIGIEKLYFRVLAFFPTTSFNHLQFPGWCQFPVKFWKDSGHSELQTTKGLKGNDLSIIWCRYSPVYVEYFSKKRFLFSPKPLVSFVALTSPRGILYSRL